MVKGGVRKHYHCTWQIHYHILLPLKYRKALLDKEVTEIIVETARGIEERYAIEMEAIGNDMDHIHLLCSVHPKIAPGWIGEVLKSITARENILMKPSVKKELSGGDVWSGGYYVATVGECANWDTLKQCVKKQDRSQTELQQLKLLDI